MNRLSHTAKIVDIIVRIIFWFFLITRGLSLCISIYSIVMQAIYSNDIFYISQNLNFGNISLQIGFEDLPNEQHMETYRFIIIGMSIIHLPIYCLMLQSIRKILKPLINQTPFHQTVASNLKKLSILVISVGILNTLSDYIAFHHAATRFDLNALLINENVLSVTTHFSIDWSPLFFAATLFLLSYIFRYGQELQYLADETV